jgi:hypothetical protein
LYQPLVQLVEHWISQTQANKLRKVDRFAYSNLLSMFLRRDEDVLDKRVGRMKRAASIMLFGVGLSSLKDLGSMYPDSSDKSSDAFDKSRNAAMDFKPLDQLIKTRLQTLGFMGAANHDLDLLDGLRSLCLLYPLIIGTSRLFISCDDPLDIAIGAIDHAYGRAPVLQTRAAKQIQRQLLMPETFPRLMMNLC